MPPAASVLLTDQPTINNLLSSLGVTLAADDDQSAAIDGPEPAYVTWAINVGSATVLRYCQPRYDGADLASSVSAWEWATVLAALRLARRRMNPAPEELIEMAAEAISDLKEVRAGRMNVEDIGERSSDAMLWSNVTVDPLYRGKQIRVQRRMSEQTPRERPVAIDWPSEYFAAEEFGG